MDALLSTRGNQMHKQILRTAVAVAVTGSVAQAAFAQSSVTLYGIVDAGFTYTNNQKGNSAYQATQGNVQGSRWGLLGSEDLGGGNKVLFRLENGFSLESGSSGQGGRMFGRSAWVGLSNNRAGTITLGRQYNSVQDYLSNLQINGVGAMSQYGNAIYDNDDINNTYRTDNAVKYTTPTFSGFTANAMYAFSNTAGDFSNNRAWSVGADYAAGPVRRIEHGRCGTVGQLLQHQLVDHQQRCAQPGLGRGRRLHVRAGHRCPALHELAFRPHDRRQPAFRELRSKRALSVYARHAALARLHLHEPEQQFGNRVEWSLQPARTGWRVLPVEDDRPLSERYLPAFVRRQGMD
jgi:hypothetical protein